MTNEGYFIYNGKYFKNSDTIISPENRSFRYGDGFFETILYNKGRINFSDLHADRINHAIDILKFERANHFNVNLLWKEVEKLVHKNRIEESARIRINFFRGNGGLFDAENNHINYIIQAYPLINNLFYQFSSNGLQLGVFPYGKKACDSFSSIKSNSTLCYVMAAIWAKENKVNDAIVLNQYNRIADTTIANLFVVTNENNIITPKLSEGCVAGVLRRFIIEESDGMIMADEITMEELYKAKEIFLTNCIKGIMWVDSFEGRKLENIVSQSIFQKSILQHII